MDDMSSNFYEEDEPAEKIHRRFETAAEKGLTARPLPFGAVEVVASWTVGVARSPIVPGTPLNVQIIRTAAAR
jgi:hypothetical protein